MITSRVCCRNVQPLILSAEVKLNNKKKEKKEEISHLANVCAFNPKRLTNVVNPIIIKEGEKKKAKKSKKKK